LDFHLPDLHLTEWTAYLFRWIHLITGISWIGSSFYFMWLDAALEPPAEPKPDVEGELWMVHSGGFYEVERKRIGPGRMPKTLHWFKYEALFTWITGVFLLGIVYYLNAGAFMVDPAVSPISPGGAVALGVGTLVATWFIYDGLWQSPIGKKHGGLATAISLLLAGGAAFLFCHYFSGRAAFIHTGAMFGTWMVANVWVRILPAQQKMIDATKRGETPDFAHSGHAKRRSVHNTYMTFPVLFMMLSNHYSNAYGQAHNWLTLMLLIVLGASIRHVMVAKDGKGKWAAIPAGISALALVALGATPGPGATAVGDAAGGAPVRFQQVEAVIQSRCVACHASEPAIRDFGPAPGGVRFDSPERIHALAERIKFRAVVTKTMPLANRTQITEEERALLGRWIDQGARTEQ
jgi:uncharacterized membrane protein